MAAMFGIDLSESENFRVGQPASQILFNLLQIVHFLFRECQAFLFVVFFEVVDIYNGLGLDVYGEYILVEPMIHALQHRVMVCVFIFHRKIFFDTAYAAESHILRDLYSVGTPWSNHFAPRAYKPAFQVLFAFRGSVTVEPA